MRSSLSLTATSATMPVIGIALEEHVTFEDLQKRLPADALHRQHMNDGGEDWVHKLKEVGPVRVQAMDRSCTAIQVLSWGGPGADRLRGQKAVRFARDVNDSIAEAIKTSPSPKRFRAFAHLCTSEVGAAVKELERCVKKLSFVGAMIVGMQQDRFLDSPEFAPILSAAQRLDVPLYLHPGPPPAAVTESYHYTTEDLSADAATLLSMAGWSWHSEVGLHVLRLCYSGTLDKYPKLKIIVGHNGEMLPMMMHRSDSMAAKLGLKRPISAMLRDHVWITLSGIFSVPPLRCAIDTFGSDHVCWSVDYPYVGIAVEQAHEFVKTLRDTMSARAVDDIMHENARKIMRI